jgi:hypothetical protein
MIDWIWKEQIVSSQEILDAMRTLSAGSDWYEIDLISEWTRAETYLSWANDNLARNDQFGWDAAICYAKRAVCRQIDALIHYNHLQKFSGRKYPEKAELLTQIGLPVPGIVQELIIDPRNEIEHAYLPATQDYARRAVEVADLFLRALATESDRKAVISFAKSLNRRHDTSSVQGHEYEVLEFSLTHRHSPWLLIDLLESEPRALVLSPSDETLMVCPLEHFEKPDAIALAAMLRQYYSLENFGKWVLKLEWAKKLKRDLALSTS